MKKWFLRSNYIFLHFDGFLENLVLWLQSITQGIFNACAKKATYWLRTEWDLAFGLRMWLFLPIHAQPSNRKHFSVLWVFYSNLVNMLPLFPYWNSFQPGLQKYLDHRMMKVIPGRDTQLLWKISLHDAPITLCPCPVSLPAEKPLYRIGSSHNPPTHHPGL